MDIRGQAWTLEDRHGYWRTGMDTRGQAWTLEDRHGN